jgi:hypothetical protein
MALFDSIRIYSGAYNATDNTFTPSISSVQLILSTDRESSGPGSDTYEIGDQILLEVPAPNDIWTYLANTGDGWIGESIDTPGLFQLFTNNSGYPIGVPIGTTTNPFAVCFLTGTMIATPDGERPVETLEIGDIILTADGSTRAIRWLGRQSVVSVFANPLRSYPIRIAAGVLGDGLPQRDLFLSPDHALLVDGVLVQAGALVNNTSVTRVMRPGERFTYYHIETTDHALILAEGAPAETFVDNVSRRTFDNYAEYEALHGEETVIPELDQPRAVSQRQVPRATRERLAAVATALGYGADIAA